MQVPELQIGDAIVATRKVKSKIYYNRVIGPVITVWDNACRVRCNAGTDVETDFQLFFSDWTFKVLQLTGPKMFRD